MTSDWQHAQDRLVFQTLVGSRLHGTHTEQSDHDIRGIWIGDPVELVPDQMPDPGGSDYKLIEIRRFARDLMRGDNNALEILYGIPMLTKGDFPLFTIREQFLSAEWLRDVLTYADRARARKESGNRYGSYLAHAWRVTRTAHHAQVTGEFKPGAFGDSNTNAIYRNCRSNSPDAIGLVESMVELNQRELLKYTRRPLDRDLVQRAVGATLNRAWHERLGGS